MKKDVASRDDLFKILTVFYQKATLDDLIGEKFVGIDMTQHIPVIVDFWDSLLFNPGIYMGRPFQKHIPLRLEKEHYAQWLKLFFATIDELYEGPICDQMKERALNIASIFSAKSAHFNSMI